MEKTISELDQVVNMNCPYHLNSGLVQCQPPSQLLYRVAVLRAVHTPRSESLPKLQHSSTPTLRQQFIGTANILWPGPKDWVFNIGKKQVL
jgi:hypothetical protein